jgi:hypothetical protein
VSHPIRKLTAPTLILGTALLAGGILFAPLRSGIAEAKAPSGRQRQLQEQRLEILKALLHRYQEHEKKSGDLNYSGVKDLKLAILNAELDLCESAEEQVPILEKRVEVAREEEERTAKLVERKAVASTEIDFSRCRRLAAEIDVERAKNGERIPVARSTTGQME